jgi:5-methylcytosine-specific restriction enzyme subunit McrC
VPDVRYKLTDDAPASPEDYYQLLAYTTALALPEGLLIYCRGPKEVPESSAQVVRGGPLLHTRAVDASGSPDAVAAEISAIADWLLARYQS